MQATAICYYRRSTAGLKGLKPSAAASTGSQALRPQPSATIGVRGCRLHAFNGLKRSAAASTGSFDQALRPQPSATIGVRNSRLQLARPQRSKTLRGSFDQALRPQPSATIGVRGCRLPALKNLKLPSSKPQRKRRCHRCKQATLQQPRIPSHQSWLWGIHGMLFTSTQNKSPSMIYKVASLTANAWRNKKPQDLARHWIAGALFLLVLGKFRANSFSAMPTTTLSSGICPALFFHTLRHSTLVNTTIWSRDTFMGGLPFAFTRTRTGSCVSDDFPARMDFYAG